MALAVATEEATDKDSSGQIRDPGNEAAVDVRKQAEPVNGSRDVAGFREAFPAFTVELVPDARIAFHLRMAQKLLDATRWGDLHDDGIGLYAAHQLSIELEAAKDRSGTGAIGAAAGPVSSETKTVGGVSHSTTRAGAACQGSALLNAGQYNGTVYGQMFWQLVQIVGCGGMVA